MLTVSAVLFLVKSVCKNSTSQFTIRCSSILTVSDYCSVCAMCLLVMFFFV